MTRPRKRDNAPRPLTTLRKARTMASADLTAARLRELLHYDPETGIFTWRVDRGPGGCAARAGDQAGHLGKQQGYILIGIDGQLYLAHRLAWLYVHGVWPTKLLDHEDTDRANNRIRNLREATRQFNCENIRTPNKNNKTGLLGVSPHKNRFAAVIHTNYRKRHLGLFDTPEEAHAVYIAEKRRIHAGNTL